MNRRGTSVLLIPLLAATMAVFYPAVGRQTTPEPNQVSGSQSEKQDTRATHSTAPPKWPGGRARVREFLGLYEKDQPSWEPKDSRYNTKVEFLIATVPDPIDSALPHMFDRNLASIQTALQWSGYLLSSFDLPWQKCLLRRGQSADNGPKDGQKDKEQQKACKDELWDTQPGVLLFSKTSKTNKTNAKAEDPPQTSVLLLYLVGETPASGIHQEALQAALDETAWFCDWPKSGSGPPVHGSDPLLQSLGRSSKNCTEKKVRILGPTFSGSAQSLDFALSSWMHSTGKPHGVSLRMISGTATAINLDADFPNIQELYQGQHTPDSPLFSSMQVPDDVARCRLLEYLKQVEPDGSRRRVALLRESGTVYGSIKEKKKGRDAENTFTCSDNTEVTPIFFPLHISQLRAALEKVRQSQQQVSPQLPTSPQGLSLAQALEEVNQPQDTDAVPPLSQLDLATSEQVIAQLLSTISRQGYRYIGIVATDVRDEIFLAQEVHEHSPATVLFAFTPDLLLLHPEVNSSLRGMMLVTSYPVFNTNLLWSPPHPPPGQSHELVQFPDPGSEGVYNATLALLGANAGNKSTPGHQFDRLMLEYGLPFDPKPRVAPLWITVVGRNQMWPLRVYDLKGIPAAQTYMYQAEDAEQHEGKEEEEKEKELWFGAVYPTGTTIFMAALATLCVFFCLPLLGRLRKVAWREHTTGSGFGGALLERALGAVVSETYRRPGELYLLAACVCLGTFLVVALAAILVPALVMGQLGVSPWRTDQYWQWGIWHWGSWHWGRLAFSLLCAVVVGALLAACGSLCAALWSREKKWPKREQGRTGDEWNLPAAGPMLIGAVALVLFAAFLSGGWLRNAVMGDYRTALFTSIRSLDLLSGVSPLLPLLLIFLAGFLWALSCFRRLRQLETFESNSGFLAFAGPFGEIGMLERHLRSYLSRPSLRLPGAIVLVVLAECSIGYLFGFRLVNSFEDRPFHWLLGSAFFVVHLALWCGVLRFCCAWQELHRLLRHLRCSPLRAYQRFQSSNPAAHKIDLASAPTDACLFGILHRPGPDVLPACPALAGSAEGAPAAGGGR